MRQLGIHSKNVVITSVCLIVLTAIFMSNVAGPVAAGHGGRTGASFDSGSCGYAGCHSGGTALAPYSQTTLYYGATAVTTYVPGTTYTLRIKVASSSVSTLGYKYGFQTTCVSNTNDTGINNWGLLPSTIHSGTWNSRTYLEQNATLLSGTSPYISVPWTAPPAGTGTVKFHTGGCIVNGNSLPTGDSPVNDSLAVTEDTAGCIAPSVVPTIYNTSCFGGNDGEIIISTSGGTGVTAYNWTGPGGYTSASSTISGLFAGTYTLVLSIVGGCYDTVTEVVGQPFRMTDSIAGNFPVCSGGDLNVSSYITGGVFPFTYLWSTPGSMSFINPNFSIAPFSASDTGIYWLTITDDNGCVFDTSIDIGFGPGPMFTLGNDTTVCGLDSLVLGTSWVAGDSYMWNTGDTMPTLTIYSFPPGGVFVYTLTVTNAAGCATSDSITIVTCPLFLSEAVQIGMTSVYPNPASDVVHLTGLSGLEELVVFDLMGQVVHQSKLNGASTIDLNLRDLPDGLYTLTLTSAKGKENRKLNVAH